MKVAIRTDASPTIGTGHLMRCLTLADGLRAEGAEVMFLCAPSAAPWMKLVEGRGHGLRLLGVRGEGPGDGDLRHASRLPWGQAADAEATAAVLGGSVDWLIVDHYGLDARWESRMRAAARKIMAIDDLADRPHDCDLLLDQNLTENMERRYESRLPPGCRQLLGPRYALLRPEFAEARANLRLRNGELKRIMIFMGGSDTANETGKALTAIRELKRGDVVVDVVVGAANPHRNALRELCSRTPGAVFHCQTERMAELMAEADLALGSAGTAALERACVGLPAVVCILVDNQRNLARAVAKQGCVINLGESGKLTPADYRAAVDKLTPGKLRQMSSRALELVDGKGAERVALALLEPIR